MAKSLKDKDHRSGLPTCEEVECVIGGLWADAAPRHAGQVGLMLEEPHGLRVQLEAEVVVLGGAQHAKDAPHLQRGGRKK